MIEQPASGAPDIEVILVAGMGCRTTSSVMLPMMRQICQESGIPVHSVEGLYTNEEGVDVVATPSQQREQIDALVQANPNSVLISHCIGGVAVLDALEVAPEETTAVMISPPFGSPRAVIEHQRIRERMEEDDTGQWLKIADFPESDPFNFDKLVRSRAVVSEDFHNEITDASYEHLFVERSDALANTGRLKLVVPEADWNESPAAITGELWSGDVLRLADTCHALNTRDGILDKQWQNCKSVVRYALGKVFPSS